MTAPDRPPDRPPVRIAGLATALPQHRLDQATARRAAGELFGGRVADFERLAAVFDRAGVRSRALAQPLTWYYDPHGWAERTAVFVKVATDLLEQAIGEALARAGLGPEAVDLLVVLSSTGIATPSLDSRLAGRLGLRADVARLPVFGLGCAGGALGLARGAALARSRPGSVVVVATVELCSLILRLDDLSKTSLVANALFGDGAAAAVLVAEEGRAAAPAIAAWGEHQWPDSLDVMGWRVDDAGLGVVMARAIPDLVRRELAAVADRFLDGIGRHRSNLAAVAAHPGGARVLDALDAVFGDGMAGLDAARAVLAEHGNMSAPTVLFVLERVLAARPPGPVLATALGPGFTAGFLLIEPGGEGP